MINDKSKAQSLKCDRSISNTVHEPLIAPDQDYKADEPRCTSSSYARSLIEASLDPLVTISVQGKITDVNEASVQVTGVPREQLIGTDFSNYFTEPDKARTGYEKVFSDGLVRDYPLAIRHTSGHITDVLYNAAVYRDDKGRVLGAFAAARDISKIVKLVNGLETTRKELEVIKKEADEAREYAENLINTVREPLICLDQDLRVVTVSRSFYDFFKVKPEDTVGQLIYDLGNKQWDIPKLRELLENILPRQTSFDNYEVEHDFATIGRRTMLLNARQIERAWGKERIILLAVEDITERRRLGDLLAESESRYRRLFETASDGILLLEKQGGRITHANSSVDQILGFSESECLDKQLVDIGISIDTHDFPAIIQELNRSGILNYKDVSVKTKSGKDIYTDIYIVDRAELVQCNIRDVTENKRVMEELQEAQRFSHQIIASAREGFIVYDTDLKYKAWNRFMEELTGIAADEILGKNLQDTSPYPADKGVVASVEKALQGKASNAMPFPFSSPEKGKSGWTIQTNAPLRNNSGEIIGVIGTVSDISEHKKLETQLRQAQKMEAIGTLTGGIAHDFNNILSVIMGYGAIVMETLAAGSPAREDMNAVLSAAEKAAELTKRLLLFSRKQIDELKLVNINVLIQELQKMLCRMVNESIEFHLDLADLPLIVQVDTGLIEQVLINLCVNARDAMPEGGKLTISTGVEEVTDEYALSFEFGKPGKYALLTVADTGQGMDAEIQKKIFEPFFTTKIADDGTGLGLAICYGIIKQHKGFIHVYSEPGCGAEFKIYLPLREEPAAADQAIGVFVPVKGGQETVLVAEDEPSLRKLATRMLGSFGYKVIAAEDGEVAITKFMENREGINLLLLDMIMPKKNGKEVAEAIRKVSPDIKILFASGYTMDVIKTRELSVSGYDFIQKPYHSKNLLKKVREVLDR